MPKPSESPQCKEVSHALTTREEKAEPSFRFRLLQGRQAAPGARQSSSVLQLLKDQFFCQLWQKVYRRVGPSLLQESPKLDEYPLGFFRQGESLISFGFVLSSLFFSPSSKGRKRTNENNWGCLLNLLL